MLYQQQPIQEVPVIPNPPQPLVDLVPSPLSFILSLTALLIALDQAFDASTGLVKSISGLVKSIAQLKNRNRSD